LVPGLFAEHASTASALSPKHHALVFTPQRERKRRAQWIARSYASKAANRP
jgi:hypothetical protein